MNRPDPAADMIYGESFHDGDIVVALTSLKNLCSERAEIHSGKSFMNLYVETLVLLESYATQKPSRYFAEKLVEMPHISEGEINNLVYSRNRSRSTHYPSSSGSLFIVLLALLRLIGLAKKELEYNLQDKFESICRISDNLVYVLKHPDFEQLYYEKKDSKQ